MRIVIPTHRRVARQVTLAALPEDLYSSVVLVTSDEAETQALKQRWSVKALTAPVNTIGQKRQWIAEKFKRDTAILMLDDDMDFYARCPRSAREFRDGRWRPQPGFMGLSKQYAKPAAVLRMFERLEKLAGSHAHFGISSRMGNDLEPEELRLGASRLMHAFGFRPREFHKARVDFTAVTQREDMHMALCLYKLGHASAQIYDFCVAPGSYGAPGGCSDERTVAASDAAALRLAELHAPFVKVVDRAYKGTPRKEVVVQWKRALEYGRGTR